MKVSVAWARHRLWLRLVEWLRGLAPAHYHYVNQSTLDRLQRQQARANDYGKGSW